MRVAVIYNKKAINPDDVINIFGAPNKETYNPKTVELVAAALEQGGHNVRIVEGKIDVAEELQNFMPRVIAGERPGMVFNMAYGIQGQSRYTHLPAMLEMLGVPYVGSGPQAHAVALDKIMTKIVLRQNGLPTPEFWFFSSPDEDMASVTYPVIVKPKMEAVSMGMRVVDNIDDLRDAVREVVENYRQQALVERFIAGREFAVGLLGNGADVEVLPGVEFELGDPNAIQSHNDKMKAPVEKVCPPNVGPELSREMTRLARESFRALGISDFARIDLRMDSDGNLYILELNSMASLGQTGSYVHAAKTAVYTYETLVNRMLDVAAVRYFGRRDPEASEKVEPRVVSEEAQPLRVQLRSYLRSNLTTMIDYLDEMVRTNSYVHNTEGVNSLGNWVSARLTRLGLSRQVYPQTEVGNLLYLTNHEDTQNDILLLGHLDTFYNYQDHVPFREQRGMCYGSGVAESKGGLAIMIAALQALRFARRLRRVRCGVLLITDDTLGGRYSRKLVAELSAQSRCVVGLKHGGKAGGIVTSCGGRMDFHIEMANIKDPDTLKAENIVTTVAQKILAWQKLSSDEEGTIVNPTRIEARSLYGIAPDFASVLLDAHFKEKERGDTLEEEIRKIARRGAAGKLQVRVRKGVYRPPMPERESTREFFERVARIAERLETRTASIYRTISSAACYVPDNIPVLEGLGPAGGHSRSPNEFVFRDSLIDRATLLALIIRESSRAEKADTRKVAS
jgi:D-alanine-D-alanine ligase